MLERLDLKDRKLLFELDSNSRQPLSKIAKRIRVNKNTLKFRFSRLLKEGHISGFYPVLDISKLGYLSVRVYFNFFNTTPDKENQIFAYFAKHRLVGVVAELETIYDVMISVVVPDIYEFEKFWNEFKHLFRDSFQNEKINIFTKVIHFKRKYLSPNADQKDFSEQVIGGSQKTDFDGIDLKIIALLTKNCRESALEMSKRLKLPSRTILYRIRQLEKKGIILGYRINLDLEKIGYEYYKINFQLHSLKNSKEIESFCKMNKNILFMDFTLSDYDFEVDVEIKNKAELYLLIKELKSKFGIKRYEIIAFKKYHKLQSILEI